MERLPWIRSPIDRPYRLGVALLAALALSGVPLGLGYDTNPTHAHDAVDALNQGATGWLRSLHSWMGNALIALVIAWITVGWIRADPKQLGWTPWTLRLAASGVLAAAYLSGGILTWDQQGWESWAHVEHAMRPFGPFNASGMDPDGTPLNAIFLFHVALVPVVLLGLLAWNLTRNASSSTASGESLGRLVRGGLRSAWLPIAAVALAAVWIRPGFGPAPTLGTENTSPDWPFLWMVPIEHTWGMGVLILAVLVLGGLLVAVPRWAPRLSRRARTRWLFGIGAVLVALSIWGLRT